MALRCLLHNCRILNLLQLARSEASELERGKGEIFNAHIRIHDFVEVVAHVGFHYHREVVPNPITVVCFCVHRPQSDDELVEVVLG